MSLSYPHPASSLYLYPSLSSVTSSWELLNFLPPTKILFIPLMCSSFPFKLTTFACLTCLYYPSAQQWTHSTLFLLYNTFPPGFFGFYMHHFISCSLKRKRKTPQPTAEQYKQNLLNLRVLHTSTYSTLLHKALPSRLCWHLLFSPCFGPTTCNHAWVLSPHCAHTQSPWYWHV